MKANPLFVSALLACAILAGGCASTPQSPPDQAVAKQIDCSQLGAEMSRLEAEKRSAQAKEKEAWKAVIPFAVVARYASGKSQAERAEKQIEALQVEFVRQGCNRHAL